MSEAIRRKSRDHSKFDNMSTAELNEYLRQDAERDDSELDEVLYVMEVLAQREKEENNDTLPDVRKAWASFQINYNTADSDGSTLHDFDDEAAVICIILVRSFTVKALGYDIWDAIIVWTKDTFSFTATVDEVKPTPNVKQIPEELTELADLMIDRGLLTKMIPGYIPEGYKMTDLQYDDLSDADTISCQLSNAANDIILTYSVHSGGFTP